MTTFGPVCGQHRRRLPALNAWWISPAQLFRPMPETPMRDTSPFSKRGIVPFLETCHGFEPCQPRPFIPGERAHLWTIPPPATIYISHAESKSGLTPCRAHSLEEFVRQRTICRSRTLTDDLWLICQCSKPLGKRFPLGKDPELPGLKWSGRMDMNQQGHEFAPTRTGQQVSCRVYLSPHPDIMVEMRRN